MKNSLFNVLKLLFIFVLYFIDTFVWIILKIISVEFDQMFSKTKFEELYTFKHTDDPSGKSLVSDMYWEIDNGDKILLACYKWNAEFDSRYVDEMRVTISSKEFDQFLLNE